MVARDILLAREMKTKVHIAHISTKGSVEIVRKAKTEGVLVTCEVTPHHQMCIRDSCSAVRLSLTSDL